MKRSSKKGAKRATKTPEKESPKKPAKRQSRWAAGLILVAASVIIALFVAEVVVRVTVPIGNRGTELVFFQYDELMGWTNKPGAHGTLEIPASTTTVDINEQGQRDDLAAAEKTHRRIIVLGDSQTWGYGVEADERYTEAMEDALNEGTENVEVINMGVSGYGTGQEYLLLRTHGLTYHPDVVVVGFYSNDLGDNVETNNRNEFAYPRPILVRQDGAMTIKNYPVPYRGPQWQKTPSYYAQYPQPQRWLLEHSRLFYIVAKQLEPSMRNLLVKLGVVDEAGAGLGDEAHWKATFAILNDMAATLKQRDIKLVVAVIPARLHVAEDVTVIDEKMTVWGDDAGVTVVTMSDAFRAENLDTLYLKYDSHLSPAGHALAGELIAEVLREN